MLHNTIYRSNTPHKIILIQLFLWYNLQVITEKRNLSKARDSGRRKKKQWSIPVAVVNFYFYFLFLPIGGRKISFDYFS